MTNGIADDGTPTLYLDMSVINDFSRLTSTPTGRFVYSSEHFSEIGRGTSASLLDVLDSIGAYELSVTLNDRNQITDHASLYRHEDIHSRYAAYIDAVSPPPEHFALFHSMVSTLWGANTATKTLQHIRDLPRYILPAELADREPGIVAEANRVSRTMLDAIAPKIHQRPSLKTVRRQLGSADAKTGNTQAAQVIPEIWKHVAPQLPGLTIEQVFGKAPLADLGLQTWPVYLGIIQCYGMLNTLGYQPDEGLAHEDRTANVLSDATHVANAAFCDVILTKDRRMAAKAAAIYAFFGLHTAVGTVVEPRSYISSGGSQFGQSAT